MLAIIVPYRNRPTHLARFIPAIKRHLQYSLATITIVEQLDDKPFNKGKLSNVGFLERPKNTSYISIHDVDHLPVEVDYNTFPVHPVNICAHRPYQSYFGGVVLISVIDYLNVNGHGNEFWGWGGEDDDLAWRLGTFDTRDDKFELIPHDPQWEEKQREHNWKRVVEHVDPKSDGLSTCKYQKVSDEMRDGIRYIGVRL